MEVSAPELGAADGYLAVFAISDKDGGFYWTYVEFGILAAINLNLRGVVEQYDGAIGEIFNHEINSINIARFLDQKLIVLGLKHEVSLI